jgi:hypothetical protein
MWPGWDLSCFSWALFLSRSKLFGGAGHEIFFQHNNITSVSSDQRSWKFLFNHFMHTIVWAKNVLRQAVRKQVLIYAKGGTGIW